MTLNVLANIDVEKLKLATKFYCSALELTVGRRFGEFAFVRISPLAHIAMAWVPHASGVQVTIR